jgi:hypothetical protein
MSKLIGNSSLDVANAPKPKAKEKKMKLKETDFVVKTYRISAAAVNALEDMTKRFSHETRIKLAMGKVLELAIFNAQKHSIEELLK